VAEYLVYEWPAQDAPPWEPEPDGLHWVDADPELIRTLFASEPDRLRAQIAMLAQDYVGLLCVAGDEWCAYAWMRRPRSPGPPHLPPEARQLPCYWITYCRTKKDFQRRGLFTRAILKLVATAQRESPGAYILIDVETNNIASRRAIERAGFVRSGLLKTVSIGLPKVRHVVLGSWRSD